MLRRQWFPGKDSGKDCSRIEADGIPLADLLREAPHVLAE